jgi:hypothetical protein
MSTFRIPDFNNLEPVFYEIDEMTQPSMSSYSRNVQARYSTFLYGGGQELLALIQSASKGALQLLGLAAKILATPLAKVPKFSFLNNFNAKMPQFSDFWITAKRVVVLAVGLLCSWTIGIATPGTNLRIQVALGVVQEKAEEENPSFDPYGGLGKDVFETLVATD